MDNDCGLCGKRTKSRWCPHLVSAGLRCDPPIVVGHNAKIYYCPLSKLEKTQKLSNARSGQKKPRKHDYKDLNFNSIEDDTQDLLQPLDSLSSQVCSSIFRRYIN